MSGYKRSYFLFKKLDCMEIIKCIKIFFIWWIIHFFFWSKESRASAAATSQSTRGFQTAPPANVNIAVLRYPNSRTPKRLNPIFFFVRPKRIERKIYIYISWKLRATRVGRDWFIFILSLEKESSVAGIWLEIGSGRIPLFSFCHWWSGGRSTRWNLQRIEA